MSVTQSDVYETGPVPYYQLELIEWLKNFRNTEALCDLVRRHRFSEEEVRTFRDKWATWLKPAKMRYGKRMYGVH